MAFDLFKTLGLQSKRPHYEATDPYANIRPLLKQVALEGMPEWKGQWQDVWSTELMPQIQEQYRAKRGMGIASTPEISALGRAGTNLMSQLGRQDLMGRLQALGMYARTPMQYTQEDVTTPWQNLLNLSVPALTQLGTAYLAGGQDITPEDIAALFNTDSGIGFGARGIG